ncbi:MAG TPA: hypothetical protein VFU69_18905, partial [Ktedonobacterales bacterium]|nr:hypothetical protein [Ktedonobacterales bacterium]
MFVLLFSGCSAGASSTATGSPVVSGATATPTGVTPTPAPAPASCTPHVTTTAEAWATTTAHPQVMGSINGVPTTTLSHFVYPLGLPSEGEFGNDSLVALAWAPDAQHLAVAVAVNVGMGQYLFPYVVDTKSHAVTRVKLSDSSGIPERAAPNRVFAWADNHTLLIFGAFSGGNNGSGGTVSYSYDIPSSSLTPLPGVTAAYEGVVRCSTLFYLEITPLTPIVSGRFKGAGRLHRYDLTSHSEIGSPIMLGDTSTFSGAEGNVTLMGWDVSPDGKRIAYQKTSVSLGGNNQIVLTSKFIAANADGSGARPILTGATSSTAAFLAISPDGKQVAVTNAAPTPTVLSGSMSGGAAHFYQPDAAGPPVWLAGSTQFEADSLVGAAQGVARWPLNTAGGRQPGSVVHPND